MSEQPPLRRHGAPISLADLLEATARLSPRDDPTRAAILAALGIEPVSEPTAAPRVGPWLDHDRVPEPTPPLPAPPRPSDLEQPADAAPINIVGGGAIVSEQGTTTFATPEWANGPMDPFLAAAGDADSLPPPPLFPRAGARAIISAVLATWREGDQLDVERAVAALATGRPLRTLPMRPAPTLRRGAQVLVDYAGAMAPFRADVLSLLADLQNLFSPGHVQVLRFKHCAGRGVRNGFAPRRAWDAPARGVPVLIVSDFGAGTPLEDDDFAGPAEWLAFARRVTEAGCNAVALTPFAPRRWPGLLTRTMTFVHWCERTSARQTARALRESTATRARRDG